METKQIKNILKNKIAEIYYIKNNDIILSIQLVLKLKKRAIGLFIGTTLEGYEKHANSLLYNNIIETLKENNYNTYNLMGVPKQNWEGLERYKLGMGAEKVDTWSITSPFLQNKLLEYSIKIYRRMKKLTD